MARVRWLACLVSPHASLDFHELDLHQGQIDLQHVQADELWVKIVGRKLWMAMAVPSRLWLGGG
jgi:hypothetical protein